VPHYYLGNRAVLTETVALRIHGSQLDGASFSQAGPSGVQAGVRAGSEWGSLKFRARTPNLWSS